MVEQFRFGSEQISLEFPGGQIGKGEQPEFTAHRELTEETGYIANSMTLLGSSYPNPATHDNKCWYFLAEIPPRVRIGHFIPSSLRAIPSSKNATPRKSVPTFSNVLATGISP